MPSDSRRLQEAFQHITRIKSGTYPAVIGRDDSYRIAERPWSEMPERNKLAILQDAVDWTGVTNRDHAHIILSEIDPSKISDEQRNRLIEAAIERDAATRPQDRARYAAKGNRGQGRER